MVPSIKRIVLGVYVMTSCFVHGIGLTPVQMIELNSLSTKLRNLETRFEQVLASKRAESDTQRQMMELQKQVRANCICSN